MSASLRRSSCPSRAEDEPSRRPTQRKPHRSAAVYWLCLSETGVTSCANSCAPQITAMTSTDIKPRRRLVWPGAGLPASDGAGVKLNRVIGQPALPDLDPFLMLD